MASFGVKITGSEYVPTVRMVEAIEGSKLNVPGTTTLAAFSTVPLTVVALSGWP